jgi:membrane protease YdiL (CAAX protease family)
MERALESHVMTTQHAQGTPDWLVLGVAVLILGVVAEAMNKVSPRAATGFVALVILGYAATRSKAVISFLQQAGFVGNGANIAHPSTEVPPSQPVHR